MSLLLGQRTHWTKLTQLKWTHLTSFRSWSHTYPTDIAQKQVVCITRQFRALPGAWILTCQSSVIVHWWGSSKMAGKCCHKGDAVAYYRHCSRHASPTSSQTVTVQSRDTAQVPQPHRQLHPADPLPLPLEGLLPNNSKLFRGCRFEGSQMSCGKSAGGRLSAITLQITRSYFLGLCGP